MTEWSPFVFFVDEVLKALADPTRRALLDELFSTGRPAGLVVTRRRGREKLHFLNPVPIRLVHDRRVSNFVEGWVSGLSALKQDLEVSDGESV